MKLSKKKLKEKLGKAPRVLAEKAFLTFIILFFLALILGGLVYYQNLILIKKINPETTEKQLQFKEKEYQEVLRVWQGRETKFNEADSKQYPNPFLAATTTGLTQ